MMNEILQYKICVLLCVSIFAASAILGQARSDTGLSADALSVRSLSKLQRRYQALSDRIDERTSAIIQHLQAKEKMQQGQETGGQGIAQRMEQANDQNGLVTTARHYISGLDSMRSAIGFLEKNGLQLPADKLQQIKELSETLGKLQSSYARAGTVEDFVKEHEQLLWMNKEVYYYRQELSEYRNLLNKPDKLEEKLLSIVGRVPAFQQYWQQYSMLAQLFPMPASCGSPQVLNGLQTNTQVAALVQQRLSGNITTANAMGSSVTAIPSQYVDQAQEQLSQLKDKVSRAGGSNSDMPLPDFKPDGQHGKKLLQRLTYGFNVQTAPGSIFLPSIADLAVTLGLRVSDNIQAGIGASYKLGLGKLSCIHFSHEGVGARSYLDVRARGSFWITGGWEYNYLQHFENLRELHSRVEVWQKSALLGLTKKYRAGKKEVNIQLLYDLLADSRVPVAQPLKFRTGINF